MKKPVIVFIVCLLCCGSYTQAQQVPKRQIDKRVKVLFPDSLVQAEVLLLGVFHFNYPGLDAHKTTSDLQVDILSAKRQKQVRELTDMIAKFRPTKIAVEYNVKAQQRLDEQYSTFTETDLQTKRDETYQIAFRLARKLKHPRVYAFDSQPFRFRLAPEDSAWMARQQANEDPQIAALGQRYMNYFSFGDTLATKMQLKDYLLYMNSEESLRRSHGVYLVYSKAGTDEEPAGADGFITRWYNRNIRMFSNVQRMASQGDRILVLVGAGHVPILKHLLENAPELKLRRLDEFVK